MLTVKFKSGVVRRLNCPVDFFIAKNGDTMSKGELTDKITDIISDMGKYRELYHATLYFGSRKMVEIGPNKHNEPIVAVEEKIDESVQLKDLKKDTKNFRFTQKIVRNINGVFITPIN